MDPQPIREQRILEALEACRPGSRDVDDPDLAPLAAELAVDPELRDLFERLQQLDANLGEGFRDVPLPAGLQTRLLERLAAARAEQCNDAEKPIAVVIQREEPRVAGRRRFMSRRRMLSIAGSLSAAAVLLVAAWVHFYSVRPYTESVVLEDAKAFFITEASTIAADSHHGYLISDVDHRPPSDLPLSRSLVHLSGIKWRPIRGFLGSHGVAYDMPGNRATLYVVERRVAGLRSRPPITPTLATGGYSVSAWQSAGLLYVLVVNGNPPVYQNYLTPPGPLT